jgi:hypothetical protein
MPNYRLINRKTTFPMYLGDPVKTFRGEKGTIIGIQPPHRQGTSGKVVIRREMGIEDLVYPSVIDAEFIEVEDSITLLLTEGELHMMRVCLDGTELSALNKDALTVFADLRNKLAIAAKR